MKVFNLIVHKFTINKIMRTQIMCEKIIREEIYPIILNRYKKA